MNINSFTILGLFFLGLLTSEMSFSQTKVCDKPIYTVCSVTINTKHEIQTLRQFLTGNIEGTISTDGCIAFHEFVRNGVTTLREMLEFVPGGQNAPTTTCSVLMISGHHDMTDSSCANTNTQGVCDRRNSIVYSDDFNDNKTSPSGPILNLAALSRSNAVCPEYKSSSLLTKSYSGLGLLGTDLLATFLFSCNLFRDDTDENFIASTYLSTPTDIYSNKIPLTFRERTTFLFHNSAVIFGFDSTAAPGRFTAPITKDELNVFEKSKTKGNSLRVFLNGQLGTSYPGGANKFTCWLNDLRKYKGMDVSDEAKKSCGNFKNIKACDERIKLDCKNLLAGDSDKDDKNASGSMVRCTLPHEGKLRSDLIDEKSKYCKTREIFFSEYYAARTIDYKRTITQKYNFLLHTPNKFYSGLGGAGLLFPRRDESFRGCYNVPEDASGGSRRPDLRRVECNDFNAETELNYLY